MSGPTLHDTLTTLSALAVDVPDAVRVVGLEVSLPVDVVWDAVEDGLVVTAPMWRWRTAFDRRPGRLSVRFGSCGGAL